jgi:uncharacterized protein (TIGR00369 family)
LDIGLICEAIASRQPNESGLILVNITCWDQTFSKRIALGRGVYINYERSDRKGRDYRTILISGLFQLQNGFFGKMFLKYLNESLMKKHKQKFDKSRDLSKIRNHDHLPPHLIHGDQIFNGLTASEYIHEIEKKTNFGLEILGVRVINLAHGNLSLRLPFRPAFTGNFLTPCLHGGITASLVDHCGGFSARTLVSDPLYRVSTVELTIDYLLPAPCFEEILCESSSQFTQEGTVILSEITCWNETKTQKLMVSRGIFNVYAPRRQRQ